MSQASPPSIVDADIAASFGYCNVQFVNPFTGELEDYTTQDAAINSMLQAAAAKIAALEGDVRSLKAFLAID